MDIQLLEDIGLTNPQALAYKALIEKGSASAPAIAAHINESRSNTYKVLDKLCDLGLAVKDQNGKKQHYYPTSPAALEKLIRDKAAAVKLQESKLNAALPSMLDYYFAHSEQAGIRFFQGKEGMRQIFTEILKTGQTFHLLRSPADLKYYDPEFFSQLKKKRRAMGIKTISITPDVPSANHDPDIDQQDGMVRTWVHEDDYTAPVEWNIAGDKVAFISYGEEAMGILIESPQIAESFRQVFQLAAKSIRAADDKLNPRI
ncbi:MAG TPA: helix-turn-helix domain-containing protein [Candidatus Saccharimonadales bacterium]|nr:helix-turn-helix domain-containing protein [Candidatus Saccharimonadales bacterium]